MLKKITLILVLLAMAGTASAQAVNTPAVQTKSSASSSAAPASTSKSAAPAPASPLAPITQQIGQTIQNLVGTSSASPAPAPAPAPVPAGSSTPASAAAPAPEDAGQVADTFATHMLNSLVNEAETIKAKTASLKATLAGFSDFIDWAGRQSTDTKRLDFWRAVGNDLLIGVGAPLLGAAAIWLLLMPLRLRVQTRQPQSLSHRLAVLFGLLIMRLVPLLVFLGASLFLLDQNEPNKLPRFVILNVIYAIGAAYAARVLLRGIFAPSNDRLRFISMQHRRAVFAFRWFSAFTVAIIYGYFFIDVAAALRVPSTSIALFEDSFATMLAAMAIVVIAQTGARVAVILRGHKEKDETFFHSMREGLARRWHIIAIAYLVISAAVIWLGIEDGIALLLRGTVLTFIILVVLRLASVRLDAWETPAGGNPAPHRQILSFVLRPLLWIAAAVFISMAWGMGLKSFITTPLGQHIISAFATVAVTVFILTFIYELINTAIERHLSRGSGKSKKPAASARARTLLPMLRHSVLIIFSAVAVLTFLASLGINIAPVLAGAGVLGVAIGFGSQTLVKDFLTGLFIVIENTVAVGDVVKIGDFGGVVETISIRTIRLRDFDGSLHILPFSEVTKITNMTRGFAYAVVDVGVAYDTDIEKAMKAMREVGAQVQEDPLFKRVILEPIEVMGIEKLNDSSITLRARMRTRSGKQWDVKRLLMLRIVQRFATENIEIPYPTVTHVVKSQNIRPELEQDHPDAANTTPPSPDTGKKKPMA